MRPYHKFDQSPIHVVSGDIINITRPMAFGATEKLEFQVTGTGTALGYRTDPMEIVWGGFPGAGYFGPLNDFAECPECDNGWVTLLTSRDKCTRCNGNGFI